MRLPIVLFRRKFCRCRVLCFFVIVAIILLVWLAARITVQSILELEKCPACYGVSLCSELTKNSQVEFLFDTWGSLGTMANLFVTKNVFSGHFKNTKVILKRLGTDQELQKLDQRICHTMGLHHTCKLEMENIANLIPKLQENVKSLLSGLPAESDDHRLTLCPSTGHMNLLFKPLFHNKEKDLDSNLTANIWATLLINPEPLLLQINRAEDGWPVPHYIGSCGRIVMMENAGVSLFNYYSRPWPVRAGLALQLLLAADRFTYSHPHFAFYFLDISPDNIAVNEEGKLSFVDLEHVIVVDRHPPLTDTPKLWNDSHYSEVPEHCDGCYVFSAEDICTHHISDHNHFITCQQLLAPIAKGSSRPMPNGLLHSLPPQIVQRYPQIQRFLNECSAQKSTDRVRSARRLRDVLNIASKESPLFSEPDLLNTWKYF